MSLEIFSSVFGSSAKPDRVHIVWASGTGTFPVQEIDLNEYRHPTTKKLSAYTLMGKISGEERKNYSDTTLISRSCNARIVRGLDNEDEIRIAARVDGLVFCNHDLVYQVMYGLGDKFRIASLNGPEMLERVEYIKKLRARVPAHQREHEVILKGWGIPESDWQWKDPHQPLDFIKGL